MSAWRPASGAFDVVAELIDRGVGRAAVTLSEFGGQRIEFSCPAVGVWTSGEVANDPPAEIVITQTFTGRIRGRTSLCFPANNSVALAQAVSENWRGAATELDAELRGILLEVGSILLGGIMGSLLDASAATLHYSLPELQTANGHGDRMREAMTNETILLGDVYFCVPEREIHGSVVLVIAVSSLPSLLEAVLPATVA